MTLLLGSTLMLVSGLVLQIWSLQQPRVGSQYALQLPVVFLYALAGALLLFIAFPDSVSEGRALGFSLGGAAGFSAFFMICSFAWLSRTRTKDAMARQLADLRKENKALTRKLAAHASNTPSATPLRHEKKEYELQKMRRVKIGLITGDLNNVIGIDVWTNSENTRMEMSRITEPTISAVVRFLGAERDAHGFVLEDRIADELSELMAGVTQVPPGHVMTTYAGNMEVSHGVRRVIHVAAVEGEAGQGYTPVRDIGRCVRNVLAEIDRLNSNGEKLRSVVLPLFGTGGGSTGLPQTAEVVVSACADYLTTHRDSSLRAVYLLAHTGAHVAACELALQGEPRLAVRPD